jgi:glycosyltransferase involved in cell wall biosynthesis
LTRPRTPTLGWVGLPIRGTGYGEESHAFLTTLRKYGLDVTLLDDFEWLHDAHRHRLLITNRMFHPLPQILSRSITIWRTTFEADSIPDKWVPGLNALGEVWVPSRFNIETFTRSGVTVPVIRMPAPLDLSAFLDIPECPPIQPARQFTFLSVGTWQERKGWDVLLRAYLREFKSGDDVCLTIRSYHPRRDAQAISRDLARLASDCKGQTKQARVRLISAGLSKPELVELYRTSDAFVLASHGEGWGLPYMEAMAAGLPTIGTDWGGSTDFMTEDNSFLIKSKLVAVPQKAVNEFQVFAGKRWAEPDEEHLRILLRQVREAGDEVRETGRRGRLTIATQFSQDVLAELLLNRLRAHA